MAQIVTVTKQWSVSESSWSSVLVRNLIKLSIPVATRDSKPRLNPISVSIVGGTVAEVSIILLIVQ
jgi:hypothetical protein